MLMAETLVFENLKKELPKEFIKYVKIDKSVRRVRCILDNSYKKQKAIDFSIQDYLLPVLEEGSGWYEHFWKKALNKFINSKRMAFLRFLFVFTADFLDIFSNGSTSDKAIYHMPNTCHWSFRAWIPSSKISKPILNNTPWKWAFVSKNSLTLL